MFERFTKQSRRVLVYAQEEARALGHGFIGSGHLLLALMRENEGVAARALEASGVELSAARTVVEHLVGDTSAGSSTGQPFTPRAKKALDQSLREALRLGSKEVETAHLLLGVIRQTDGIAARTLRELGVDLPRLSREATRWLSEQPTEAGQDWPAELAEQLRVQGGFRRGGGKRLRKVGPFLLEPGALRNWLYNRFIRRHGLESVAQIGDKIGDNGYTVVQIHAAPWGSCRALCGIDRASLRRLRIVWGSEPIPPSVEARRSNNLLRRCPRCLQLAPVDSPE